MKVPSFLKNKYVLKFLIFMAIVNVLGYVALEEFNSMALFIVMILLSRYFSKNTSINILIAIIVTSCFTLNNKVREGFKEKETSKIFKRFYSDRPDKFGEHSGLGLNIVKNLVDLHDGEIVASNRLDCEGAIIDIKLPSV